jgi:predicted MFS family arabinose efflux permease
VSNAIRLRIFLPFALGYFVSYLYRVINAVLAPDLAADIGVDPSQLGLLTSAYFITFGACQAPLGVLLDRYGPRRVEGGLLVVAAAGAWIFAHADSLFALVIGRGLIGIGVSACLMAAFKAFVLWFPKQQLPRINGFQMASGGLGALCAATPVQTALSVTDWRGVFTFLSLLTLVAAAGIFFAVPEPDGVVHRPRLTTQLKEIGAILTHPAFWRVAPWATLTQAAFMAIHGLWSGPFLRDVVGLGRQETAGLLLLMALAMIIGYVGLGTLAERLSRRGIPPMAVAGAGMLLFMLQLLFFVLPIKLLALPSYLLFGFFGTAGILVYAVLSQQFAPELAGRVNTALNLLVFVAAFAAQWGIGAVINLWPVDAGGGYAPAGYRAAFAILLLLQILAAGWYGVSGLLLGKLKR